MRGSKGETIQKDWREAPADGQKVIQYSADPQTQQRLELALEGLLNNVKVSVSKLSENNKKILGAFLSDFINTENPKPKTIRVYCINVVYLLRYSNATFKKDNLRDLTGEEIISYLQSYRKSRDADPEEKWISTYNLFATTLIKFFKWLYFPTIPAKQRERPAVCELISFYAKKNLSHVKPEDLWLIDEDRIFLKYCPDPRIALYHTHSLDTSGRPHELLSKRIGDFKIKNYEGKTYGEQEIGRTGKTKGRIVPLISCIPYLKAWLAIHPEGTNPNAFVYRSMGRRDKYKNKPIEESTLHEVYTGSMKRYFTKLLDRADVPPEDKAIIQSMLQKPWYPYLRRHMSLTEKARLVNDYQLRLHAGWTKNSPMINVYTHELGGESSKAFLQAYNIIPKDAGKTDGIIMPKECPECRELNKPDAMYCVKCKMHLSFKAFIETKESEQQKAKENEELRETVKELKESDRRNREMLEQLVRSGNFKPVEKKEEKTEGAA